MSGQIPYDEMRRLCGLPDIEHLDLMAVIRKHGLNQAISFMQLTGTFQQEEDGRIQWTPDPMPWANPVDEPSIEPPEIGAAQITPKPKQAPPMWVRDPATTRRTAYGPTRRVK